MITLTEQAIIAEFTGKPITADPLPKWVWDRGNCHVIYCAGHLADDKSLRAQFGITDKLKESWHRRGNELPYHQGRCHYILQYRQVQQRRRSQTLRRWPPENHSPRAETCHPAPEAHHRLKAKYPTKGR